MARLHNNLSNIHYRHEPHHQSQSILIIFIHFLRIQISIYNRWIWTANSTQWLYRLEKLMFLIIFVGLLYVVVMQAPRWSLLLAPGVERVHIAGNFIHLDRLEIYKIIESILQDDFFGLDIQHLEQLLLQLAWVKQVDVSRVWPGSLNINVTEHQPIAYWRKDSLLSDEGIVFKPKQIMQDSLPILFSSPGKEKEILLWYQQISTILRDSGLSIRYIQEDNQSQLSMILDNGFSLILGHKKQLERIHRFAIAYREALDNVDGRRLCIDMRYVNGFAIATNNNCIKEEL